MYQFKVSLERGVSVYLHHCQIELILRKMRVRRRMGHLAGESVPPRAFREGDVSSHCLQTQLCRGSFEKGTGA
jgi:hypothetical protein